MEKAALVFQNNDFLERVEIIREKGTDRSKFFRGQVDKYRWMDYGSSYLPSDLNAAYLWAQLEMADTIRKDRLDSWNYYNEELRPLAEAGYIEQPFIRTMQITTLTCIISRRRIWRPAED